MAAPMETEQDEGSVPQYKPLPGQVPNSAGGFSYQVDDLQRLRRFLVLGTEGGTYYITERALGKQNAESILRLIQGGRGVEVVQEITKYSLEGRTPKQNPIIFALALCAREDDRDTKAAAYEALNKICRIPTHLFAFVSYCESLSVGTGWGRAHRRAVGNWYLERSPKALAMAVTKYQQREGWAHKDLLRLSHVKTDKVGSNCVLKYVIKGLEACQMDYGGVAETQEILDFLLAVESAKSCDEYYLVQLIKEHGLVREHVPSVHLNSIPVWSALLESMPMTAMIRNLGKMSTIGLLTRGSDHSKKICVKLRDEVMLKQARVHPFNLLVALKTYEQGKGDKGKLTWDVNKDIVSALNDAFYLSFKVYTIGGGVVKWSLTTPSRA
jgi:60 kDa SS-A/Ro ribonucleoprotein